MKSDPKMTQGNCAKALHVSTTSLRAWAKLPGAPRGWDVAEWRSFMATRGLALTGNSRMSGRREEFLTRLAEENWRSARAKRLADEKATCSRNELDATLERAAVLTKSVLQSKLTVELGARASGLNQSELLKLGNDIFDECCCMMQSGIDAFGAELPRAIEEVDRAVVAVLMPSVGADQAAALTAVLRERELLSNYTYEEENTPPAAAGEV